MEDGGLKKNPMKSNCLKEANVDIKNSDILTRFPVKQPNINIKVSSYYMNNREIFINFINSMFEPYKKEIDLEFIRLKQRIIIRLKQRMDFIFVVIMTHLLEQPPTV